MNNIACKENVKRIDKTDGIWPFKGRLVVMKNDHDRRLGRFNPTR